MKKELLSNEITTDSLKTLYSENGVSESRIKNVEAKFQTQPDEFTVTGVAVIDANIEGTIVKIPSFTVVDIKSNSKKTIPINSLFANYNEGGKAVQIKKQGSKHLDKWLVVNNKKINSFAEGFSEYEFIKYMQDKSFKSSKSKAYPVFTNKFDKVAKQPIYFDSPEEAVKAILPKDYRPLVEITI